MRIVLTLEMTMTIDVQDDMHPYSKPEQVQTAAECAQCGWTKLYSSDSSAKKGLAAHKRFCKGSGSNGKRAFDQLVGQ